MQKILANFLYWVLMKTAESYYGESIKEEEVPYPYYFQSNYSDLEKFGAMLEQPE